MITWLGDSVMLGAEQPDFKQGLKNCYDQVADADFSTKEARESSFRTSAGCAADAFCAAYKVPPGVCSTVVGPATDGLIVIWNSIWGGDDEERERRAQLARMHLAWAKQQAQLEQVDAYLTSSLSETAANLIRFYDEAVLSQVGRYGGEKPFKHTPPTLLIGSGVPPVEGREYEGFEDDQPMRQWLVRRGMTHEEDKYLNADEKGTVQSPNIMARYFEFLGQGVDPKDLGPPLVAKADEFLGSLRNATLRVRQDIAMQAVLAKLEEERRSKTRKKWFWYAAGAAAIGVGTYLFWPAIGPVVSRQVKKLLKEQENG